MNEYEYSSSFEVTDEIKEKFDEYGYILIRNFFEPEVIQRVKDIVENNKDMSKYRYDIPDKEGHMSSMIAWNHAGHDVTGMMARSEKVVNLIEKCLEGEVYIYHSKFTMKWPKNGAGFHWHQDYGYWYDYGILFPDMGTIFIAIDECTVENGCLQLLRGSHKCGRIDHSKVDGQFSPQPERLNFLKEKLITDVVEMKPGDAVFFHCNTLHMSEVNTSPKRRIGFPIAYNRSSNDPTKKHHHPCYTPIEKVTNEMLLNCTNTTDMSGKDFIEMAKEATLTAQLNAQGIITTDESWFHYYDPETKQQSSQWKHIDSPPPKKARVTKSLGKTMFIMFMDRQGMILTHAVPKGQTVNSNYYSKVLRRDLVQALRKKRPQFAANLDQVILHHDNAPAHTAFNTQLDIDLLGFECLKHPPYSPDLAPMNFAIFPYIKSFLRGHSFDSLEELHREILNVVYHMKTDQFVQVFDDWIKRHRKCIALKGDYVEKN